jgi:hypothetical protein
MPRTTGLDLLLHISGGVRDTLFLNAELCAALNLRYRLAGANVSRLQSVIPGWERRTLPNLPRARMKAAKVRFIFTNLRAFASNLQRERMPCAAEARAKGGTEKWFIRLVAHNHNRWRNGCMPAGDRGRAFGKSGQVLRPLNEPRRCLADGQDR